MAPRRNPPTRTNLLRELVRDLPETPEAARDRALLLVGFAAPLAAPSWSRSIAAMSASIRTACASPSTPQRPTRSRPARSLACRTATRCFLCGWQEAQRDPDRFVSEVLDFCAVAEDDGRQRGNGEWREALAG